MTERKASERVTEDRRKDEEYRAQCIREREEDMANPEEWNKTIAEAAERLKMDRKPLEIDTAPQMLACPHCSKELPLASNLRFFTSEQLRDYADALEAAKALKSENISCADATKTI